MFVDVRRISAEYENRRQKIHADAIDQAQKIAIEKEMRASLQRNWQII
jgi:hypothetical protein